MTGYNDFNSMRGLTLHDGTLTMQAHLFDLSFRNLEFVLFLFLLDFQWEPLLHEPVRNKP